MGLFGAQAAKLVGGYNSGAGNWADKAMLIGAALKDASSGGSENLANIMQMQAMRQKMAQQQLIGGQLAAQFNRPSQLKADNPSVESMVNGAMAGDQNAPTLDQVTARTPGGMASITDMAPMFARAQAMGYDTTPFLNLAKAAKGPEPKYIEGTDGIYEIGPRGITLAQPYPKKPDAAPMGYRWDNGNLKYIPGGPADPAVVGNIAGLRRDIVVSRPMPRSGGGSRGGGGKAAKPKPWERSY